MRTNEAGDLRRRGMRWVGGLAAAGLLASSMGVGCIGNIGDGDVGEPSTPEPGPGGFTCTPGDPSPTVLPRLSREQYLGAVRDFAAAAVGEGEVEAIIGELGPALAGLPADLNRDHDRLDQAVTQPLVDGQYYLAAAFANAVTANDARRTALLGACGVDADPGNDATCIDALVRRLGQRAHRRPMSDAEVAFYVNEVYGAVDIDLAAVRDLVVAMMLSPNFLYRIELDGEPVDGRDDLYALSGYELASRLALHFWDGPPDAALYADAESGALLTEDGYAAAVERMLADPKTAAAIDRLYAEWLVLDDLAPLHQQVGNPDYDAFVGADVPTEALRERLIEDALDLVRYTTWQGGGDFADLFTSTKSFARTEDVAAIYGGVPLWDGTSEPPELPAGARSGLLTRPAMLATGSINTHPILRGREVRKRVLCQETPAPPPNAMDAIPELDPIMTERERTEIITQQPGSSCAGCHALMNPIGFTLENYDGLGRMRSEETIYADDGSVLASLPIDTASEPRLSADDERTAADGIELSEMVAESEIAQACFARHAFRFTFARAEDDAVDGCELQDIRARLGEGRPLREVLRDIALSPTFRHRKLAD